MRARAPSMLFTAVLGLGSDGLARATPSITVASTAGASGLTLDGQGSSSSRVVKVADLELSTDAASGLTVSITSGALTRAGGSSIAFQVALVDHGASAPAAAAFTAASGAPYLFVTGGAVTLEKDLYIRYTAAALQDPGGYAAAIDLDVTDN
jgi:hypothetical protein